MTLLFGNLLQQLFHGSPSAFSGISTEGPGEKSAVTRVELLTVRSFCSLLLCEHRIENPENASEDEVSPEAWEGHTHAPIESLVPMPRASGMRISGPRNHQTSP